METLKPKVSRGRVNKLVHSHVIKLHTWMLANEKAAKSSTYESTAQAAEKDLGFTVTAGNIQGMVKDLGWEKPRRQDFSSQHEVEILARCLVKIASDLNINLPSEVMDIANRTH